ncbi:MAG: hypothetical protein RI100_01420 [Nitrosarchaeum sp.]|jgi:hypothetical protein|uniref:hypothetical protein n=1 Tax=Nitrosarchaeum sp. TaxID=2026886 RepID=UPI002DE5346B|nr:hypothetical protein [Nitrosarchaeum sp.]
MLLLFFIVFLFFLLPVYAEQIPDYDNPYAPIFTDKTVYTWTDKVQMTIHAPSWNTDRHLIDSIGDEDHPIKISTRGHSLSPYKFTETDVNSGKFTAEIILTGFFHDADGDGDFDTSPRTMGNGPTSGFLESDSDSALTITFEFADGVVLTKSVPIQWNIGSIQFSEENYSSDQTAIVHVIDPDLNLNPESLDHIPIKISSNSDVSGIEVSAVETSKSSGIFSSTISFTQNLSSSGNRLYAIPGDTIFAKYDDYTIPKPYSISDNLAVKTSAIIGTSSSALQSMPIIFSDSMGNQIQTVSYNEQIQIVGKIINPQNYKQKFVYLFQVKDENNFVVSLSWIQGEISANQNLDISQSWIPQQTGNYSIETYTWNSLTNAAPLSTSLSTSVFVN